MSSLHWRITPGNAIPLINCNGRSPGIMAFPVNSAISCRGEGSAFSIAPQSLYRVRISYLVEECGLFNQTRTLSWLLLASRRLPRWVRRISAVSAVAISKVNVHRAIQMQNAVANSRIDRFAGIGKERPEVNHGAIRITGSIQDVPWLKLAHPIVRIKVPTRSGIGDCVDRE